MFEINRNANFRLKKNIHSIILGHSHSACAYNDSIIPNFKNLSQSGESYFYTFQKLQKLVSFNPQIKTVYFEFSNNQIDTSMERWTFNDPFLSSRLIIYEPFLNFHEKKFLLKKNPFGYIKAFSLSTKKILERIAKKKYNYINILGGYEQNFKSLVKLHLLQLKGSKIIESNKQISKTNLYYLKRIINFLNQQKIKFYLIRSPIHQSSFFRGNEKLFQRIILNYLKCEHHFIDFANFTLTEDNYYDLDHLNFKGSLVFSKMFRKYISNYN